MNIYISKNIKTLRKKQGMTQQTLGDMLDLKSATISGYENGVSEPSLEIVGKIARIFKISSDELVFNDLSTPNPPTKDTRLQKPISEYYKDIENDLQTVDQIAGEIGDENLKKIIKLQELRMMELSREIKERAPDLAKRLNIE